jgi:hypothetical protein
VWHWWQLALPRQFCIFFFVFFLFYLSFYYYYYYLNINIFPIIFYDVQKMEDFYQPFWWTYGISARSDGNVNVSILNSRLLEEKKRKEIRREYFDLARRIGQCGAHAGNSSRVVW